MILVGRDEILSRFADIPAVLKTFHKLYPAITCEKDPSFILPWSRFSGTKFSHVIASVRLRGMKQ